MYVLFTGWNVTKEYDEQIGIDGKPYTGKETLIWGLLL